ncbi:LOW QUALITY PROTEIN: integrin alpha-E [Phaethornis superciliosus]
MTLVQVSPPLQEDFLCRQAGGLDFELAQPGFNVQILDKVGSYLGSELCPFDVNHDVTHLLLVGAPLYHTGGEEGRVYVYCLETEAVKASEISSVLQCFGPTDTRFDFTNDGLQDITVGSLENMAVLW